jgi:hypothetical protein
VAGASAYVVRWRRTDAADWQHSRRLAVDFGLPTGCHDLAFRIANPSAGSWCAMVLPGVRVDDWVFGVSSVASDGSESPVASAVPGGAFRPYMPPPPPPQQ